MVSLAPIRSLFFPHFLSLSLSFLFHILSVKLKSQSYSVSFLRSLQNTLAHTLLQLIKAQKKREEWKKNYIYIAFESWQFITYIHSFIHSFRFVYVPFFFIAHFYGFGGAVFSTSLFLLLSAFILLLFIQYCIVVKPHQY